MIEIDVDHPCVRDPRFGDWLDEHTGVVADHTYHVEINEDRLTAYQYAVNEDGELFRDGDDIAEADPVTVRIKRPCPVEIGSGS